MAYPSIPGVRINSGVLLNDTMLQFLQALRKAVPTSKVPDMLVTSGIRTAAAQASAMLTKAIRRDQGSTDPDNDITKIYRSSADKMQQLLASGRDRDTWTRMIQGWIDSGYIISDHLRGDALDIDANSSMTGEQVLAIANAAKALGANVLVENMGVNKSGPWTASAIQPGRDGSHIHIDGLGSGALSLLKRGASWWLWGLVFGGIAFRGLWVAGQRGIGPLARRRRNGRRGRRG